MKNNYAFIDGQNLHFGIKSMGWKIDHRKFRQYLEKEHDVTKAYIFLGFMEEHQDLYNVLQEAGFICFFKPLVRYEDGNIKGNVDADMVLQVMVDIDKYDSAIIISGDGDFSGLLRHLLTVNKLGQLIIPNREKYSSLFDRLDGFDNAHVTYMNDLRSKLSYRPSNKKGNNSHKSNQHRNQNSKPNEKKSNDPKDNKPKHNQNNQNNKSNQKSAPAKKYSPRKSSGIRSKKQLEQSLLNTIESKND